MWACSSKKLWENEITIFNGLYYSNNKKLQVKMRIWKKKDEAKMERVKRQNHNAQYNEKIHWYTELHVKLWAGLSRNTSNTRT